MVKRLLVLTALCALLVRAQSERGNITGTVTDRSGAVVPNATVSITLKATNTLQTVTTSTAGDYNLPSLLPGDYRVEVSANGFKRAVRDDVVVTAGGTIRVDVPLQLGQVSESVEIQATAIQLQTDNARISTVVQNKLVDELPLVVGGSLRTPFTLVSITPEARGSGNRLSLGGGQAAAWDATLDGVSVSTNRAADTAEAGLTAPSVEAITEFSVDTNGFKAEYGQAGGGVMTFVSKSGTNAYHSVLYEFLRNDALDARGFFAAKRAVYKQHDFGGTFGGPVIIPKLYNGRNKTFFFASYEGFRNRDGATDVIRTVPTPEMYTGDFSKWVDANGKLLTIYDPATTRPNPNGSGFIRDAFPGNIIPQSRFSAFANQVIPFAQPIAPNRPTAIPGQSGYVRNNYVVTSGTTTKPTDKGSLRLDQNIGSKHRLSYLYNRTAYRLEVGPGGPPGLPVPLWDGQVQQFDASAHRVSYDWTISPSKLNHVSFGTNTFYKNSYTPSSGGDWKGKVCLKNAVDCNVAFPTLTFTDSSTWGNATYNGTEQPLWTVKDDFNWLRGKHTYKLGATIQRQQANGFGQQNIMGRADFSYLSTSVPGATSQNSGSSFASFLLGEAISGNTETIRYLSQRYDYYGFYIQDDWRATSRLTVNYGLRYEFTQPPYEALDQYSDFTPDRPNPAAGGRLGALRFAGEGAGREGVRSLVPGWYGGWGPRLSLAYSLNQKTTIRTGYGRSFGRVIVGGSSGHYSGFIGQYNFASVDQGITPAFRTDTGLPSYPLPPQLDPAFANNQNVDYWQPYDAVRAPENNSWTFSIQRQLSSSMVLEAAYNGNAGSHLPANLVNINQLPTSVYNSLVAQYGGTQAISLLNANITSTAARNAGFTVPYAGFNKTVAQSLRPYPQYLNIVTGAQNGDKSGHSSYHALVLKLERRYSAGLLFQWNYTFSKLLTDADTASADAAGAQDQYNRRLEKSIGAYDQTHVVKINTLYELPFGKGKRYLSSGWMSQVLGGWRLGAIQVYASGYPIALMRNNPLPIFNGGTRPVINSYENWRTPLKGDRFDPQVDTFLNKAAFPDQNQYTTVFGNATRFNPKVRAFPDLNENVSLGKSFHISETSRVDFRWEAFNVFNRTVFGTGSTNLNSNTFGVVTNQVNTPRQMQLALKLYW